MNHCLTLKKSFRILALTSVVLTLVALNTLADVATLREKGPKSGAAFSNLGLTAMSANAKIAMRDAQVKILLKKGEGDTLLAECEANFILENVALAGTEAQDYLVAFPVTGLKSKVVTVDRFAVTVDGKTPPIVFRQAIAISRRESKLEDKVIAGQLDAKFASRKSKIAYGVNLADESFYQASYVWSQNTTQGKTTQVKVTYLVTLHPQAISYAKSYHSAPDDIDVIPFDDIGVDADDGPYYFFDYVLRSGATWEGRISREVITLSVDPELHIHAGRIETTARNPHGHAPIPPNGWEITPDDKESLEAVWNNSDSNDKSVTYNFRNIKPTRDVLFAISAKDIGQYQPNKK